MPTDPGSETILDRGLRPEASSPFRPNSVAAINYAVHLNICFNPCCTLLLSLAVSLVAFARLDNGRRFARFKGVQVSNDLVNGVVNRRRRGHMRRYSYFGVLP